MQRAAVDAELQGDHVRLAAAGRKLQPDQLPDLVAHGRIGPLEQGVEVLAGRLGKRRIGRGDRSVEVR